MCVCITLYLYITYIYGWMEKLFTNFASKLALFRKILNMS